SLLFERTEGHPLFVTELLQWMKTEGILVQEDGAWSMHRDVTIHELPPRIGALVAERLERLPRELLKTVRAASVQGLQFAAEVVAEVRHLSRRHIAGQLESLVFEHRLLIADPADHIGDGIHRYRFRHSLFQEYLEGSFAPFTRQALHIETAEAMLRVLPVPADAGLDIGRQFELGGDLHRACEWYLQAGDRSLREFDHESALRWFGHAIDQARRLDDQTLICRAAIGMGEALRAQGDIAAAIRVGYDALEASELARNRSLRVECLASLGVFFYDIGSNDQAENFLTEALALLGEEPGPRTATACAVHYLLSYTLYARGAYSTGVEHAHRALNLAREGNLTRQEGEALVAVAYYHVELGNYEAALAFYQSAMECQRAEKDFRGEAVSLLNIGLCHIEIGHFNDALGPLEQALRFGERTHRPRTQAAALTYLGFLHEGNEQWSRAAACYAAARQLRLGADQRQLAVDALAGVVRVALATGDDDTVRQDADQLLDWLSAHGTDGIEYPIRVYLTLVHAFRALDDQEQASAALAEGLRVLRVRAEQISDADLRRSFLERVPFNRALMTLATEPVGTPAPDGVPISLDGAPRG
ncbi:MAG TPA: tetratricopeptide repeat protein, partial [Thermomicrobiales bacterium]|nr:tetratricopeptide repeat protein [Thermomicrobiales bacterium]